MRYGMLMTLLAAAGFVLSGCGKTGDKLPSKPSTDLPSKPAAPEVSKPAAPSAPSAPSTPAAPSTSALPSKPATPGEASSVAKTVEGSKPAAAPVDKTPIKADLSKIKFTAESGELFGYDDGESRAFYYANGLGFVVVDVPADGDYEIVIAASCQAAKGENAKFKLTVDGAAAGAETQLKSEDAKDYPFPAALKQGHRKIGVEFTNDVYKEGEYDLNFYLHGLKVVRK